MEPKIFLTSGESEMVEINRQRGKQVNAGENEGVLLI